DFGPFGLRLDPGRRRTPFGAERADRVDRVGIVPGPRFEPVVARGDGADRANIHQVAGEQRVDALFVEGRNLALAAARCDPDLRVGVDLTHETDAPRAEDAAVAIEHQRRAEIDVGLDALAVEGPAREFHATLAAPKRVGEILQRTLPALEIGRASCR